MNGGGLFRRSSTQASFGKAKGMKRNDSFDNMVKARKEDILSCMKEGTEGCIVLVGALEDIHQPIVAFVRLEKAILMPNTIEVKSSLLLLHLLLLTLPCPPGEPTSQVYLHPPDPPARPGDGPPRDREVHVHSYVQSGENFSWFMFSMFNLLCNPLTSRSSTTCVTGSRKRGSFCMVSTSSWMRSAITILLLVLVQLGLPISLHYAIMVTFGQNDLKTDDSLRTRSVNLAKGH